MNRLSSEKRINSAADDAARSTIASKMEAQVRSLGVAIRNANGAISSLLRHSGKLRYQACRELAVQAGNTLLMPLIELKSKMKLTNFQQLIL